MSDQPTHNLGDLDLDLARRGEEICRRFEADWREGRQPRIESYLSDVAEAGRAALRAELEALEHELRQPTRDRLSPVAISPSTLAEAVTIAPGPSPTTPMLGEAPSSVHEEATLPSTNLPPLPHEQPTLAVISQDPSSPSSASSPTYVRYFGDYEILREIARGGMGVVFQARQVSLNRVVALKMILAGQLANDSDVKRFYTEAEAAANLDHPGIVPIFEVGEYEGQHYFSMSFVEGQSLAQKLADGPLAPREAAELIRRVSEAIEYAHQQGVIHRDLKPANVLLDKKGNPRVTDFGLAKQLASDSGLTGSGQIMGTPSYMPPEQTGGKRGAVGPAADVYALGATLYALLTGRPPFQAATPMDTVIQVISDEPVPPRRLNASLPIDLETICLKCLQKEPGKRYDSAATLGEDLRRFLAGEPILARPVGVMERAWRWCRRKPVLAASLGTAAALLAVVAVGGPIVAVQQSNLKSIAVQRELQARAAEGLARKASAAEVERRHEAEAAQYEASRRTVGAIEALADASLSQARVLRSVSQPHRQATALKLLGDAAHSRAEAGGIIAGLRSDTRQLGDADARFWSQIMPGLRDEAVHWLHDVSITALAPIRFTQPGQREGGISEASQVGRRADQLALSMDGTLVAYLRYAAREATRDEVLEIVLIETATRKIRWRVIPANDSGRMMMGADALAFAPDGATLLVARVQMGGPNAKRVIEQRDLSTGRPVKSTALEPPPLPPGFRAQPGATGFGTFGMSRLEFSPDGRRLAGLGQPGYWGQGRNSAAHIWDAANGKHVAYLEGGEPQGFAATGQVLLRLLDRNVQFVEVGTGKVLRQASIPEPYVPTSLMLKESTARSWMAFGMFRARRAAWVSPDGRWAAILVYPTANQFSTTQLLVVDLVTGQRDSERRINDVVGQMGLPGATTLQFGPSGGWLAVLSPEQFLVLQLPGLKVLHSIDFGQQVVDVQRRPDSPGVWRIPTGLAVDERGSLLFGATYRMSNARLYNAQPGQAPPRSEEALIGFDLVTPTLTSWKRQGEGAVNAVQFDPTGRRLYFAGEDRVVRALGTEAGAPPDWAVGWPPDSRQEGTPLESQSVRFEPSGRGLVWQITGQAEVRNAATGALEHRFEKSAAIAVSDDGRFVAALEPHDPKGAPGLVCLKVLDVARNTWTYASPPFRSGPAASAGAGATAVTAQFNTDGHRLVARLPQLGPDAPESKPGVLVIDPEAGKLVTALPIDTWDRNNPFRSSGGLEPSLLLSRSQTASQSQNGFDQVLRAFDLASGKALGSIRRSGFNPFPRVEVAPGGRAAVVLVSENANNFNASPKPFLWEVGTDVLRPIPSRVTEGLQTYSSSNGGPLLFSARGDRLVLTGGHKDQAGQNNPTEVVAELWELPTLKPLRSAVIRKAKSPGSFIPMTSMSGVHRVTASNRMVVGLHGSDGTAETASVQEIWDLATGETIARIPTHSNSVLELSVGGPDDRWLGFRESNERAIQVFDLTTGKQVCTLPGRARFTTDGKTAIVDAWNASSTVTLHDLPGGAVRAELGLLGPLRGPEFFGGRVPLDDVSPDSRWLLSIDPRASTPSLVLHEVATGRRRWTIPLGVAKLAGRPSVTFGPKDRLGVRVNGRFRVLDLTTGKLVERLDRPGHMATINAVAAQPGGELVATAGVDLSVGLWRAGDGREAGVIDDAPSEVLGLAFSPDGTRLATVDHAGSLRVLGLQRPASPDARWVVRQLWESGGRGHFGPARGLAYDPANKRLATCGEDGRILLWEAGGGALHRRIETKSGSLTAVAFRPDGQVLATAGIDGMVRTFDVETGQPRASWSAGLNDLHALCFSPDGAVLAATGDGARLFDAATGEWLVTVDTSGDDIPALAFSSAARLALGRQDGSVEVFGLGQLRARLSELSLDWPPAPKGK